MKNIDTDVISERYRRLAVDLDSKRLLITNFSGTEQEKDFTEPSNCGGFGRIRHFRRAGRKGWLSNPLPIDPACKALGISACDVFRAQVFQNAVCNWRCWYCFVPFELLAANRKYSDWLTPKQIIDMYLEQPDAPQMIDLTGGQPDLTPEWVIWMIEEICARRLEDKIYLWSDDNLSNDYFWRFLTEKERETISAYRNYGRVCCFKGFDSESFAFNTSADSKLFERQFELMQRLLTTGIDLYAYVTLTVPSTEMLRDRLCRFIDRLQMLDENLPLKTIPLLVEAFTPVQNRLDETKRDSLKHQWSALEEWQTEIGKRFSSKEQQLNITEIPLKSRTSL